MGRKREKVETPLEKRERLVDELRLFNHKEAADLLEQQGWAILGLGLMMEPSSELERRVKDLIAKKKAKLLEKYEDLDTCSEKGWDEGHERITGEVLVVRSEIAMLEKVLND